MLPPIADPELCFLFSASHTNGDQRALRWTDAEFLGDKVYGDALAQTLNKWRIPTPYLRTLYSVFTSNHYQAKLTAKLKLLELCTGVPYRQKTVPLRAGKAHADAFEVSYSHPSRYLFQPTYSNSLFFLDEELMLGLLWLCILRSTLRIHVPIIPRLFGHIFRTKSSPPLRIYFRMLWTTTRSRFLQLPSLHERLSESPM